MGSNKYFFKKIEELKNIHLTCPPPPKSNSIKGFRQNGFSVAEAMLSLLIISIVLAASAPLFSKKISNNSTGKDIPAGVIVMWSGTTPPTGWVLCNGTNGTPDLRGRFIVGYNPNDEDYKIGAAGGEKSHQLTIEEMPSHTHLGESEMTRRLSWDATNGAACAKNIAACSGGLTSIAIGDNIPYDNTYHPFTLTTAGNSVPHENRPPYYALAYIMKK